MSALTPFGHWISEKQREHGNMSDSELARQVGLSRQQVWAIKNGQSQTKISTVREIASKLRADENEAVRVWSLGDCEDLRADVEITKIVYSLKPEQRPALIRAVRSMAEALSV